MTGAEAIKIVADQTGESPESLTAAEFSEFPEFFYVTYVDRHGRPLFGGEAYVVEIEKRTAYTVSGSMPPASNFEAVRANRALPLS